MHASRLLFLFNAALSCGLALFLGLAVPAAAKEKAPARPLLSADFERDPLKSGWTQDVLNEDDEFTGAWSHRDSVSGIYSIEVTKGVWHSPSFPVKPGEYYRLRFASKTAVPGLWAGMFFGQYEDVLAVDVYDRIEVSEDWSTQEFCFRAPPGAVTGRIRFQPTTKTLHVDDVSVEKNDRAAVGEWQDGVAAANPLLRYVPPDARWKHLAKTLEKLRSGGKLRIVLLGDSIINDTCNSMFEVLLERKYPGAQIEVIPSVRGGTGCGYYKEENRVADYVLRYKPDLLVIGGISNGYDAENVRTVIHQVRAKMQPEILVMTGPVAPEEFSKDGFLRYLPPPAKGQALENFEKYNARLGRMSRQEKVEFLDIRAAWNQYIWQSPRPQEWFMRDVVHSNSRGKQVLARILLRYFEPREEDEP